MNATNEIVKEIETKYKDRLFRMIFGKQKKTGTPEVSFPYTGLFGRFPSFVYGHLP